MVILLSLLSTHYFISSKTNFGFLPISFFTFRLASILVELKRHSTWIYNSFQFFNEMKLNVEKLRYLSKDDFRVLSAIELGSRNHEIVPLSLIVSLSKIHRGQILKMGKELCQLKLISRLQNSKYDGYRLGYGGYDYLAIHAFSERNTIVSVGNQLGVGKESDIYFVMNEHGNEYVLKIHRLGRTSFRTVKKNRDYLQHRKFASWTYFSRLAATKEFTFMKALYEHGFPVPAPIDHNRHCIIMSYVKGYPLYQIEFFDDPETIYSDLMNLIIKFAEHGLIHGDFNEFNILIDEDTKAPVIIDFPQMVSINHPNAEELFNRDVQCIRTYFKKRYGFECDDYPLFDKDVNRIADLDKVVQASGFTKKMQSMLDMAQEDAIECDDVDEDDDVESDSDNDSCNDSSVAEEDEVDDDDDDDDDDDEVVEEQSEEDGEDR